MQLSNLPARILQAFANAGSKNTIPQTTATPGAASFNQGFPALTMTPLSAGGVPPAGQDFNGILYALSLIQQWQSAGGTFSYDSAWSTANNGYPKGAVLLRADGTGFWLNTTDNNTADPDGATPTGWVPELQYGITAVTGLTNANVTLTSLQYGKPVITLAGTLTGNVQIIFPATQNQWLVVNNTTGAFTITAKTAAGTGVTVTQGSQRAIWGDGTNIVSASPPGRLLGVRAIASTQVYTPTAGTKAVLVQIVGGGGGGSGTSTTSAAQFCAGPGGGGGGGCASYLTTGFSGVTVTIGAGGTNNNNGGTSSFGALMTAGGGQSAGIAPAQTNADTRPTGQGVGGTASGGNLFNSPGGIGLYGITSPGGPVSGPGGGTIFGPGPAFVSATSGGTNGFSPGAGGSGASSLQGNGVTGNGGTGAGGFCLIYEYGD